MITTTTMRSELAARAEEYDGQGGDAVFAGKPHAHFGESADFLRRVAQRLADLESEIARRDRAEAQIRQRAEGYEKLQREERSQGSSRWIDIYGSRADGLRIALAALAGSEENLAIQVRGGGK